MSREIEIMTPEQVQLKFELAGIGSRLVAIIIDTLIQGLCILILWLALFAFVPMSGLSDSNSTRYIVFVVCCALFLFAMLSGYFLYFEVAKNGQTPGKKYAKIRVIRDSGHPVDFRSALLRNIMRLIDSLPGAYGVGLVAMFFSPEYRRLGDYVGGTLVVKVGREADLLPSRVKPFDSPGINEHSSSYSYAGSGILPQEAMPYISSIQKDEYRAIRHFLDRKIELESSVTQNLAAQLAAPIAAKLQINMTSITDQVAFLESVCSEWERRVIH